MTETNLATTASSRHKTAFSVSSILSFLSGTPDVPVESIRTVKPGPVNTTETVESSAKVSAVSYPHMKSFSFSNIISSIDSKPLEASLQNAVSDVRTTFSGSISSLLQEQTKLMDRMKTLDTLAKQTLATTNVRVKRSEKDAELLAGSERLSIMAEKNYDEVERILRLFREIDSLLPSAERIRHHKSHYNKLAPLLNGVAGEDSENALQEGIAEASSQPSRAITSLRTIQEHSPVQSSSKTFRKPDTLPRPAPLAPTSSSASTDSQTELPQRLRLAPRKSRSNLRVPQIRTVSPLPSTQLSTALPTVERDNLSTRSSMASHRSIMSTLSYFLRGQPPVRMNNHEHGDGTPVRNAEESLRKISGSSSLLGRGRHVSASSTVSVRRT